MDGQSLFAQYDTLKKLLFFETIGHTISFVYYIQYDFNLLLYYIYTHLLYNVHTVE